MPMNTQNVLFMPLTVIRNQTHIERQQKQGWVWMNWTVLVKYTATTTWQILPLLNNLICSCSMLVFPPYSEISHCCTSFKGCGHTLFVHSWQVLFKTFLYHYSKCCQRSFYLIKCYTLIDWHFSTARFPILAQFVLFEQNKMKMSYGFPKNK